MKIDDDFQLMIRFQWGIETEKERERERERASESAEGDKVSARLLMIFKDAISADDGFLFESSDCRDSQLWAEVEEKFTASKFLIALQIELRPLSLLETLPLILFGNRKLFYWISF